MLKRFVAASAAALWLGCSAASAQSPTWDLGVIAPTTGPLTVVGLRQLWTLQWWEREVNAKGGIKGRHVRLHHCNDEGSPEKAVTCARDLLAKPVAMLLNLTVTGPVRAVLPLVGNGPVTLVASPNILPGAETYVFQTSPTDFDLTRAIGDFIQKNGGGTLGIVAATDASGEVIVESAKAVLPGAKVPYNLARIDLRATDASIQLAKVATADVKLIYSGYTGGGAATLVKSYSNLGLSQPLMVGYANLSNVFIGQIKNDMPKRLLGIGLRAMAPPMLPAGKGREHLEHFAKSYYAWKNEHYDQLNLVALSVADAADAVLRNVPNPADARAAKAYLESAPVQSFEVLRFSPQSHVGMNASSVGVLELKDGRWVEASPIR